MFRALRGLVLWLMAVAIPIQGIAANLMPSCLPAQATALAAEALDQTDPHLMPSHSVASGAGELGHPHGHAKASVQRGEQTDAGSDHADHANHVDHAGHGALKCCSAACSMAILSSANFLAHAQARSPAPVQWQARLYPGVIPGGLDRPPRTLLA